MVALVDDFIGNIDCNSLITISEIKGVKEDTVFHTFKIIFTVVCLQGILIVKLIGSHERLELEVLFFDKLSQFFQKFWTVFLDKGCFDVVVVNEVVDFIFD